MKPPQQQEGGNLRRDGAPEVRAPLPASPPKRIDARELLGDSREIRIAHDGQEYRLSLTSKGKLILTK